MDLAMGQPMGQYMARPMGQPISSPWDGRCMGLYSPLLPCMGRPFGSAHEPAHGTCTAHGSAPMAGSYGPALARPMGWPPMARPMVRPTGRLLSMARPIGGLLLMARPMGRLLWPGPWAGFSGPAHGLAHGPALGLDAYSPPPWSTRINSMSSYLA